QGGSVLPAKYLATGSIEYQHWLSHQWGGAIFWDLGTASDTLQGAKIYNGVGFGVRWRSPVGPVNLDLGYGIERHQFRPNISLGVAF
ncbi:MAG: BamA/TamA family outer membrane protein, partial [Burkholderiales bacterium]|nr:BamA/TamA family outer membrane protein [Burkholderiales bacterium]